MYSTSILVFPALAGIFFLFLVGSQSIIDQKIPFMH